MGNLSFIVPTKNLDKFNREDIFKLLVKEFPKITFEHLEEFNQINVRKNGELATNLYFEQECYILDYEEDIKWLSENEEGNEGLAEKLGKLKEINPDLKKCIQATYGTGMNHTVSVKWDVEYFIKDYFVAYIFDEGIHPEYIPPDHKRK